MHPTLQNIYSFCKREYLPKKWPTYDEWGIYLTPIFIAALLLFLNKFGRSQNLIEYAHRLGYLRNTPRNELVFYARAMYTISQYCFYVFIPLLFHLIFPLRQKNPFGLTFKTEMKYYYLYIGFYLFNFVLLWFVAQTENFQNFYPLYKPSSLKMWVIYEFFYLSRFFAIEFFYRGWTLFRLEKIFGIHAFLVMLMPYSLQHMFKPFPEAIGSIFAGLVLGYLALKGRSIWPGIFLHAGVAFTMDFYAMWHSGRLSALF